MISTPLDCDQPSRVGDVSRRAFLGSVGAVLASAGYAKHLAAAESPQKAAKVVVGAHPWVYAASQPDRDIMPILPTIFADMQYAGMEGIELMHTALRPKDAVGRIADLSQKHRLSILGASFGGAMWDRTQHQVILKDVDLIVPRLAKLGGRCFGTSVGPAPQKKTSRQLDDQAEMLHRIITLCTAHGIVLNLHNHTYEVADNLYDLNGTLARIPNVKLGPDIAHLVRARVDPVGFIRTFGKRIVFMHLRDQNADGRWSEALGEGAMDYRGIGNALRDMDFHGYAVIELAHDVKPTRPLRESLKFSREFVRQMLGY